MTHGDGNRVDHALVSQGTRRDARPAEIGDRLETFTDERERLIGEKKDVEKRLAGYSKSAFLLEQQKIRAQLFNDNSKSFAAWLKRKSEMETERRKLVDEMHAIDARLVAIRERVRDEALARRGARSKMHTEVFGERRLSDILEDVLSEIRELRAELARAK